ncbi:hypothetical protein EMIT0P291_240038 [Pseudomonas sp. IT-P291]
MIRRYSWPLRPLIGLIVPLKTLHIALPCLVRNYQAFNARYEDPEPQADQVLRVMV